jgi:hypothetical protein
VTVCTLLGILQVIISGVLIFLIRLHSGKDTGLSGAFGIGGGGGLAHRALHWCQRRQRRRFERFAPFARVLGQRRACGPRNEVRHRTRPRNGS